MNLAPRWVEWLAHEGVAASHWSAVGPAAAPDREIIGAQVLKALRMMHADLEAGALVTVEPARARARLLPIHRPDQTD